MQMGDAWERDHVLDRGNVINKHSVVKRGMVY